MVATGDSDSEGADIMYRCTGLPSTCTPRFDRTVIDTMSLSSTNCPIFAGAFSGGKTILFTGSAPNVFRPGLSQ